MIFRISEKQWHELNAKYKPCFVKDVRKDADRFREWVFKEKGREGFVVYESFWNNCDEVTWCYKGPESLLDIEDAAIKT